MRKTKRYDEDNWESIMALENVGSSTSHGLHGLL
jgi:hypothetical protein